MIDKDDLGLIRLATATEDDLRANEELLKATGNRLGAPPNVVVWFLPFVDHALKGGVRTAFMLAEYLTREYGTASHFVLVSYGDAHHPTDGLAASLAANFPALSFTIQSFRLLKDDPGVLPQSDCGICTLWTTAYLLLRYNKTIAKFYLVQDFEPLFYPSGDVSAVIEATYRFGFGLLANTRGVAAPLGRYTRDVTQFTPGVDLDIFYPNPSRREPQCPHKIVFYGRPGNKRNCFLLALEILKRVKKTLGDSVEIVSVGAEWDEGEAGVEGVIHNLGLLRTMEEVARLYRSADLGLVFMTTPHPSYQPFEYMASGCVVVTNRNESTNWLLSKENALCVPPLPDVASRQICKLLEDTERWRSLRENGLRSINGYSWNNALDAVVNRIML